MEPKELWVSQLWKELPGRCWTLSHHVVWLSKFECQGYDAELPGGPEHIRERCRWRAWPFPWLFNHWHLLLHVWPFVQNEVQENFFLSSSKSILALFSYMYNKKTDVFTGLTSTWEFHDVINMHRPDIIVVAFNPSVSLVLNPRHVMARVRRPALVGQDGLKYQKVTYMYRSLIHSNVALIPATRSSRSC